MASAPEADKKLDLLMYALQATNESVKNIKNGIDTFQATLVKMASNEPGPAQEDDTTASEKTETPPEPDPAIKMPSASDFPGQ